MPSLKLSMLSGTLLFWRYLNSSFISGHVRSPLCMRYHITAWFASIVHCNVKKAIVALWRATLCSVPSFSDCVSGEAAWRHAWLKTPGGLLSVISDLTAATAGNWQTLQFLSEYMHFEAYCSLFTLGVLGVKLSHILHYSHCRGESKFIRR